MPVVMDVVIIGGGPGGYEAALVASQLGGRVTLIERRGPGGSAVLTDVVPSKTLIATAEVMTTMRGAHELGLRVGDLADLTDAFTSTWPPSTSGCWPWRRPSPPTSKAGCAARASG